MKIQEKLRYLEDRWDERVARTLDGAELLRYRSNLLGSDLRITNFGGGNTSSKIPGKDPLDGFQKLVLWIKGSGGDIGSIETLSDAHGKADCGGRARGETLDLLGCGVNVKAMHSMTGSRLLQGWHG